MYDYHLDVVWDLDIYPYYKDSSSTAAGHGSYYTSLLASASADGTYELGAACVSFVGSSNGSKVAVSFSSNTVDIYDYIREKSVCNDMKSMS
ncbi:hypothetical protein AYI69_g10331 [Smittium culicis]|uniref:Uncharacterized protein n=1 Tax=Smittium culicis TaxID=133412 RepID=A0A1R1X6F4_9FUNG|nr:hypothetical protein AYI69_g10331 [Smittium culicis]